MDVHCTRYYSMQRVCVTQNILLCVLSVNLMTCMGSLTTIVKQRPVYMKSVVQGFESLHGMLLSLPVCTVVYLLHQFVHHCCLENGNYCIIQHAETWNTICVAPQVQTEKAALSQTCIVLWICNNFDVHLVVKKFTLAADECTLNLAICSLYQGLTLVQNL